MYTCKKPFVGIVDGKEMAFAEGASIPADVAKALGLDGKPDLAEKVGK